MALGVLLCVSIAVSVAAQARTFRVGAGGESWDSHAGTAAGITVKGVTVLQPSSFTPDDNIVEVVSWQDAGTGPQEFLREGTARVWANTAEAGDNLVMVDGKPATSTGERFQHPGVNQTGRIFVYDLGASYPADRIVFYPSAEDSAAFVRSYELEISDGRSFTTAGRPRFELLRREETARQPQAETQFARQLLRFIRLRIVSPNPFDIAEVEVYGEGSVPRGQYVSKFIDREQTPVTLGSLRLRAERVPETVGGEGQEEVSVVFRVRDGADETPTAFYRVDLTDGSETEIPENDFNRLHRRERTQRYDGANWSAWSNPLFIDSTGTYELDLDFLPAPRRYLQFSLTFSGTATQVMRVRDLVFTYSHPQADSAWAEVALADDPYPTGDVSSTPTGQTQTFVYAVAAKFAGRGRGFDGLRIATPTAATFKSLTFGEERIEVQPDSLVYDADGFSVFFRSRRISSANNESVFVTFEATPLLYSTLFRGWLLNTTGGVPQLLLAGDATPQIGTGSLVVFGLLTDVLNRFELSSRVLSPNGDGRNDTVTTFYDLIFLVQDADVRLSVHDLTGRRVKRLVDGGRPSGTFTAVWDGTDDDFNLVPPGNYILRLGVDAQSDSFEQVRVVAVAY